MRANGLAGPALESWRRRSATYVNRTPCNCPVRQRKAHPENTTSLSTPGTGARRHRRPAPVRRPLPQRPSYHAVMGYEEGLASFVSPMSTSTAKNDLVSRGIPLAGKMPESDLLDNR